MIGIDVILTVQQDDEEPMDFSNSVAFDEIPTEETIRNAVFNIFSEIYSQWLVANGFIEIDNEVFDDESDSSTS